MPRIVDLTKPYGGQGKYGGTFQGIAGILDTIGKVERLRQERSLNAKVISVVAMGGGPEEIAQALITAQPQYSSGATGFLQQIAESFAPPSMLKSQVGQMVIASSMRPVSAHQRISEKKLSLIEQAEAEGDTERVERLMGVRKSLVGKTKEERIKILQSGLNAAAGQYFYQEGLEGGAKEPKNPVLYDYYADLLREEGIPVKERPGGNVQPTAEDLETYKRMGLKEYTSPSGKKYPLAGPGAGPEAGPTPITKPPKLDDFFPGQTEQPTREEFLKNIEELKMAGSTKDAKEYYDKWVGKIQW